MTTLAIVIGYAVIVSGGVLLAVGVVYLCIDLCFRWMKPGVEFVRFVRARHRGTWPPDEESS